MVNRIIVAAVCRNVPQLVFLRGIRRIPPALERLIRITTRRQRVGLSRKIAAEELLQPGRIRNSLFQRLPVQLIIALLNAARIIHQNVIADQIRRRQRSTRRIDRLKDLLRIIILAQRK